MARYIDANKLYTRVKEKTNPYGKPTLDYESGVKVLDMIKEAPTADVVEVRHGEWIVHEEDGYWHYDCPFCDDGFVIKMKMPTPPNYCENCGAKMDGGKNENV